MSRVATDAERAELAELVALLRSRPSDPMRALTHEQRERYRVLRDLVNPPRLTNVLDAHLRRAR